MPTPSKPLPQGALTASPGLPAVQRDTRQRAAIRSAIERSTRPLLPAEILTLAQREVEAMGIATVYRNLKLLVEAHEIRTVELPGDAPRYESARHAHHHHFQCKQCARVYDVHACPGNFAAMAPKGFQVDAHELTLYGTCAECARGSR